MGKTSIEWTDVTWNPIRGCSRVSKGCEHCYAELIAARFSGPGQPYEGLARRRSNGEPQWTGVVQLVEKHLADPLHWKQPRRVFVNSMSDLFHESLADETIALVFAVMALAERHTFQVLTKRPERARALLDPEHEFVDLVLAAVEDLWAHTGHDPEDALAFAPWLLENNWPLRNVWLGVSVEDQAAANARIPLLLETPAAVRFLSCEPLLGPLNLTFLERPVSGPGSSLPASPPAWLLYNALRGWRGSEDHKGRIVWSTGRSNIDWVIVGAESGPHARMADLTWIRSIVRDCRNAGAAVFVKQLGARAIEVDGSVSRFSIKGGDWTEWPDDLRVREFPKP